MKYRHNQLPKPVQLANILIFGTLGMILGVLLFLHFVADMIELNMKVEAASITQGVVLSDGDKALAQTVFNSPTVYEICDSVQNGYLIIINGQLCNVPDYSFSIGYVADKAATWLHVNQAPAQMNDRNMQGGPNNPQVTANAVFMQPIRVFQDWKDSYAQIKIDFNWTTKRH